jgi:hypothetical protein
VKDVQADEIWGFVQKKERHQRPEEARDETIGDTYCFVALERRTKLVLNYALGRRNMATTDIFIEGLRQAAAPKQATCGSRRPWKRGLRITCEPSRNCWRDLFAPNRDALRPPVTQLSRIADGA